MTRITLSIPDELKKKLDQHPEVNWPELFRKALQTKVEKLKIFEKLVQQGEI